MNSYVVINTWETAEVENLFLWTQLMDIGISVIITARIWNQSPVDIWNIQILASFK